MATPTKQQQYIRIHLNQIVPDATSPCGIFFYFKGQYIEVIKPNQLVTISFIAKSLLEENYFAYITEKDKPAWQDWSLKKRTNSTMDIFSELDANQGAAERKAKYLQFATNNVFYKEERIKFKNLTAQGTGVLRNIVQSPILNSFFSQNFSEELLKHSARVTYLLILFILEHPELIKIEDAHNLIFSSVIHELKGSPESSFNQNAHQDTLDLLKKNKMIFPVKIIDLVKVHNELYSEQGEAMDISIRIFSLINRFDHIYLTITQSPNRKIKLEKTLAALSLKSQDFDPTVLEYFLKSILNFNYIV